MFAFRKLPRFFKATPFFSVSSKVDTAVVSFGRLGIATEDGNSYGVASVYYILLLLDCR